jgi:hypothetical protein
VSTIDNIDPKLVSTLACLGDYLRDIVLVGGWVPHIYACLWPRDNEIPPRGTFDVDAAVPQALAIRGQSTLDSQLSAHGYVARLGGPSVVPGQVYENRRQESLLDIEFLIPLRGNGRQQTFEIQPGAAAHAVRYLEILLDNVLEVGASATLASADAAPVSVRVPTPGAFVYHRGLTFVRRVTPQTRAKDLYYIFETWAGFPDLRDDIVQEIERLRDQYPRGWYRRFRANLGQYFASPVAEGVVLVLPEYRTNQPKEMAAQRVFAAFRSLLQAIPLG